ncbi:MAG: regulatory protein RecX [Acutalibacteraceae bacterium]|nr:regulatory protein RecX [Acutalibacteraceae bacterium]
MKITAKQGKGTKIHIHIDGEYLLTVDEDFWFSSGYISGDEIDDGDLAAFKEAAGSRLAFNSAMFSLDLRDHSERELRTKLSRKYDENSVNTAMEKLIDLGLVNDRRYAELLVRELYERKKYGRNRVKNELYKRGIDSEIINEVIEEYENESEQDNIQTIVDIIRKKYYNKLIDEKSRQKVVAALVRLGYSFSDIRQAMSEFSSDEFYEEY